jgi:hypothetical protein
MPFVMLACFTFISWFQPTHAQNQYPVSGDALIHTLTIGTGPGIFGFQNTALGFNALAANGGGVKNVAIGYNALSSNAGGIFSGASYNTAVGYSSLAANTTGFYNTAVGSTALQSSTSGSGNTAVGSLTLVSNTGNSNVAIGYSALSNASTTSYTVGIGDSTLFSNIALYNTAVGSKTLLSNTYGTENTSLGFNVLYKNTIGDQNTAAGFDALYSNQNGSFNSAFGALSLYNNSSGNENSAFGVYSLNQNTSGTDNTGSGEYSLWLNTTGSSNSGFGWAALVKNLTGTGNTGIGTYATTINPDLTNATAIGYFAQVGNSNSVVIGNSSVTSIGGYVGWSVFSDGRFKKNINRNVPGLAFINKLSPITYNLDVDGIDAIQQKAFAGVKGPDGRSLPRPSDNPAGKQAMKEKSAVLYTGFIAQDVDKAARSLGYDFSGVDRPKDDQQSFYALRYTDFVVPLVKAVQELSLQNDSLMQANAQLTQRIDQIEQYLGIKAEAGQRSLSVALSTARLFQNIPNPSNQTTLINYFLPQNTGSAMIRINGMNGEMIKSIALSASGAGQVSLQTSQLAAGTYAYSLYVDGNLIDTKTMVLVK